MDFRSKRRGDLLVLLLSISTTTCSAPQDDTATTDPPNVVTATPNAATDDMSASPRSVDSELQTGELTTPTVEPLIEDLPRGADDPLNRPIWIEGGTFSMGTDDRRSDSERPVHQVTLSGFWIQQHEVTNEEFHRFDGGHQFPSGEEHHPVVYVTWQQAMDYARSRGGSLPTEAQWEFAARGPEGRTYPCGEAAPTCQLAHYLYCVPESTLPAMSRPDGITPDSIYDLAGNVYEWVADWHDPYSSADVTDPTGPASGWRRVIRGGSFFYDPGGLRTYDRRGLPPERASYVFGFRVAWAKHDTPTVTPDPSNMVTKSTDSSDFADELANLVGLRFRSGSLEGTRRIWGSMIEDYNGAEYGMAEHEYLGQRVLVLDSLTHRESKQAYFQIVAVLELPSLVDREIVTPYMCYLNDEWDKNLVTIVERDDEPWHMNVKRAWRANPNPASFDEIPTTGVKCRNERP